MKKTPVKQPPRGEEHASHSTPRQPLTHHGHPLERAKPEERAHPAERKVKHKRPPRDGE